MGAAPDQLTQSSATPLPTPALFELRVQQLGLAMKCSATEKGHMSSCQPDSGA